MVYYVFLIGGVFSGLGKGTITASIAKCLQKRRFKVTCIKIDPYVNVDAGTMRPTEHGEVYVTYDGGETDQDLGTYERFLGERMSYNNNITTGKVFLRVIEKERKGYYLGKTVQIFPHVSEEVIQMIKEAAKDKDIVLVEIGGTVGDYENLIYLHAAKEMELKGEKVCYILVVYLPIPKHLGEMKTKPAQHAAKFLREVGIFPDILICRSEKEIDEVRKEKLERFCFVKKENIFSSPDVDCVYKLPLIFEKQKLPDKILEKLGLKGENPDWKDWEKRIENLENPKDEVRIAIVGKYVKSGEFELPDSYISIREALIHAWAETGIKPIIHWIDATKEFDLKDFDGIIVPGGFGATGVEGKIKAIKFARENDVPYLGLCFGMQLAVIEIARNVLGLNANSTEIDPNTEHPVIDILPEQKELLEKSIYGRSMRLGEYLANIKEGTKVFEIYKKYNRFEEDKKLLEGFKEKEDFRIGIIESEYFVFERHRHRYEVNPKYHNVLEEVIVFSGWHRRKDGLKLVEFIELKDHKFFIGTQAHPEFKSYFEKPHPLFVEFLIHSK